MFQLVRTRRRQGYPVWAGAVALGLIVLAADAAHGQDLRQSLVLEGASSPIQLSADDVTTWPDAGQQIFLLKQRVWIVQGSLNIRAQQAVVWVDQTSFKDDGTYKLQIYGETVSLEDGQKTQTGQTALLQMATRGEVRIKAYANKAVQKATPQDPLFVRASVAQRASTASSAVPASPLAGTYQADNTLKTGVSAGVTPALFPLAQSAVPLTAPASVSTSGIQLTQALAPAAPNVAPIPAADGPPSAPPPALQPPPPVPSGLSPLRPPPGDGGPKQITIRPRDTTKPLAARNWNLTAGETAVVMNMPVIITVTEPATKKVLLDIEADSVCFWTKGNSQELFNNLRGAEGETTRSLEFYLSGNVEIRNQQKSQANPNLMDTEIIRADEAYYDVNRNVAIAIRSDLEINRVGIPYPIHFKSTELQQLNAKLFLAKQAEIYSSVLPSDPGLRIVVRQAQIQEFDTVKQSIFGHTVIDNKTGQPLEYHQYIFSGESNVIRVGGVPIFYFPYLKADVERPLGPLDSIGFSFNRIFGFQLTSTWDMYELLGWQRPEGTHWKLFLDEMTYRGPALGTQFDTGGKDLLGITNKYQALLKVYGIYDRGLDVLGENRGQEVLVSPFPETFVPINHPDARGRIFGNLDVQELPLGFSVQTQLALISDRNFLEQYFPNDFQIGPNQESFLYLKQQNNIWAWSFLAEGNFQSWMAKTDWLPKADGYLLGLKIFDLLTYDGHVSAGYGELLPTTVVPFAYQVTDQRINSGRFDLWQDLSLPFTVGAFKVVPYVNVDLTEYTEDLEGDARGRFYGGGGVRASIPFSRLYPDPQSDLFNVNGLYHKIVLSANAYAAYSDTPFTMLPQLDQLSDNTSDQALRDIRPWQPIINPTNAAYLLTSPVFDPQIYALRRLVDTAVDSLDSIEVIQFDVRQRLQTKRGYPGQEHVIDWMTLDVQFSLYPRAERDNFGSHWGDIEYDYVWNVGDRTSLTSSGWFEPLQDGPHVFNFGANISRIDKTNFYLGYRQIDPLNSKAIITSFNYAFSAKYAITWSSNFDIGNHIQTNSLLISRIGTDLTVSLGLSYNSIVSTFGFQFMIVPNLMPTNGRGPGLLGPGGAPLSR